MGGTGVGGGGGEGNRLCTQSVICKHEIQVN